MFASSRGDWCAWSLRARTRRGRALSAVAAIAWGASSLVGADPSAIARASELSIVEDTASSDAAEGERAATRPAGELLASHALLARTAHNSGTAVPRTGTRSRPDLAQLLISAAQSRGATPVPAGTTSQASQPSDDLFITLASAQAPASPHPAAWTTDDEFILISDDEPSAPPAEPLPLALESQPSEIPRAALDISPRIVGLNDPTEPAKLPTEMPVDVAAGTFAGMSLFVGQDSAGLAPDYFLWAPPLNRHKPLFFAQPNLERYGHYYGCNLTQSAISTAHFFATIPVLPYKMGTQPPCECVYDLGHYRPGNCNPHYWEVWPISATGLAYQALFVNGWVFFVP